MTGILPATTEPAQPVPLISGEVQHLQDRESPLCTWDVCAWRVFDGMECDVKLDLAAHLSLPRLRGDQ